MLYEQMLPRQIFCETLFNTTNIRPHALRGENRDRMNRNVQPRAGTYESHELPVQLTPCASFFILTVDSDINFLLDDHLPAIVAANADLVVLPLMGDGGLVV